jgi:hypothetical protein
MFAGELFLRKIAPGRQVRVVYDFTDVVVNFIRQNSLISLAAISVPFFALSLAFSTGD